MTMNRIIREQRKALGLTQEQVADHLGVSIPAVSKWETSASCQEIYLQEHKADQAAAELEQMLLNPVNRVQLILCKLLHAELEAGQPKTAAIQDHSINKIALPTNHRQCDFHITYLFLPK